MNELDLLPIYQEELEPLESKPADQLTQDELDRKNWLTNQIEEIKHRHGIPNEYVPSEQTQAQGETVVRTYEFVTKYGFSFDEFAKLEGNTLNDIAQSMLNKKTAEVAKQFEEALTAIRQENEGLKAEKLNLEYQNAQFQISDKLKTEQLQEITTERNTFKLERDDFENRFNAATDKIQEMTEQSIRDKGEIERLKHRETDLREQIARMPAPTARQIVDLTEPSDVDALIAQAKEQQRIKREQEEAERLAKRPKITNVRWEDDIRQQFHLAELVGDSEKGKDGETIRFGRLDINLYQVMGAEEAGRFRAEHQSTQETPAVYQPLDATPPIPAIPEVSQFPEVGPVETDTSSDTEVARQDAVSREEFEALKADVEVLKRRQGMVA